MQGPQLPLRGQESCSCRPQPEAPGRGWAMCLSPGAGTGQSTQWVFNTHSSLNVDNGRLARSSCVSPTALQGGLFLPHFTGEGGCRPPEAPRVRPGDAGQQVGARSHAHFRGSCPAPSSSGPPLSEHICGHWCCPEVPRCRSLGNAGSRGSRTLCAGASGLQLGTLASGRRVGSQSTWPQVARDPWWERWLWTDARAPR